LIAVFQIENGLNTTLLTRSIELLVYCHIRMLSDIVKRIYSWLQKLLELEMKQ